MVLARWGPAVARAWWGWCGGRERRPPSPAPTWPPGSRKEVSVSQSGFTVPSPASCSLTGRGWSHRGTQLSAGESSLLGHLIFFSLVLGHSATGLEGRSIEEIIPGFYEEFEVL